MVDRSNRKMHKQRDQRCSAIAGFRRLTRLLQYAPLWMCWGRYRPSSCKMSVTIVTVRRRFGLFEMQRLYSFRMFRTPLHQLSLPKRQLTSRHRKAEVALDWLCKASDCSHRESRGVIGCAGHKLEDLRWQSVRWATMHLTEHYELCRSSR
jgi:hypothetical protein